MARISPMMAGDSYGDIITWKWDRASMRWDAELRDGTVLSAVWRKRKWFAEAKLGWDASLRDWSEVRADGHAHPNADAAQEEAFAHWKKWRESRQR